MSIDSSRQLISLTNCNKEENSESESTARTETFPQTTIILNKNSRIKEKLTQKKIGGTLDKITKSPESSLQSRIKVDHCVCIKYPAAENQPLVEQHLGLATHCMS